MKRVACYVGTLGSGGIESATVSQFINMDSCDVKFVFIVDENLPSYQYYKSIIEKNGGNVVFLNNSSNSMSISRKIKSLYMVLKADKYDAFHIHASYPSSLLYCAIAFLAGVKNRLSTSHAQGTAIQSKKFILYQCICRLILPLFCTNRIAVSNVAGKWLYGIYNYKILPNAIDTKKFKFDAAIRRKIRDALNVGENYLVGHVGRFAPDKNHDMIIQIFNEFLFTHPNAKLLLIGDGPLHQHIEDIVNDLHIAKNVVFIKHTTEVYKYMYAMDVLLMPSFREACSVVIMEAQAASLPVLASDTIPLENKISNIMYYQSLHEYPSSWSSSLSRILKIVIDRNHIMLYNKDFPVDIRDLSQTIKNLY